MQSMNVESLIFRKLTPNEFKAITNTINSPGGGSQTYIDFPKGSISDDDFKDFFEKEGTQNANGYEWTFKVNSLSLGRTQQEEVISSRRDSSNSLREQNNENRIEIWKNERSGFPSDSYDDKNNPIVVFILKSDDKEFWAGWFYRNNCDDTWPMTKGLSCMLWKDCAYVKFDNPIPFDENDYTWPFLKSTSMQNKKQKSNNQSLQQIYYGAPGTGKSHTIKKQTEGESVIRTTFHPDSDYSTFVGTYKPTIGLLPICDELGQPMKIGSTVLHKEQIIYEFVEQAFFQAYVRAWEFYADAQDETPQNQYLIIEEINRGNCAQIFGDLFQLLDRNSDGFSDYYINADKDMKKQLAKAFKGKTIKQADKINSLYKEQNIVDKVLSGEILLLPNNLYIWATMNTSDQSLFPIDSAFKRRWDWEYEPIKYKNTDWEIEIGDLKYRWSDFQKEVNTRILKDTGSEDKMLGDYFVNPPTRVISYNLFRNKILFYLWNDVCKDGDADIFPTDEDFSFSKLYNQGSERLIASMMDKLGLVPIDDEEDVEGEDIGTGRDKTKYSINGVGKYPKRRLATELIKLYIEQNPTLSASQVVEKWKSLGNFVSHFVETQEDYDVRTDKEPRVNVLKCGNENIYVSTNGWGGQGVMDSLISAIPGNWNLKVEKIQ